MAKRYAITKEFIFEDCLVTPRVYEGVLQRFDEFVTPYIRHLHVRRRCNVVSTSFYNCRLSVGDLSSGILALNRCWKTTVLPGPAERLNKKRYSDNWLENLLVATSLRGKRIYTSFIGGKFDIGEVV